jgi:hypothetical protein
MRYRGLGSVGPPLWSLYCLIGNAYKPDAVRRLTLVPLTDTPCGDIVTEPAEGCLPQHLQLLLLIH